MLQNACSTEFCSINCSTAGIRTNESHMNPTAQIIVAFTFGVAFVVAMLVLAIKFPRPSPFQYSVFRIVLSLAAAGAAAMIPGFININVNPSTGFLIRAGGALAVFVIVFFFNPAQLAIQTRAGTREDGTDQPVAANSPLQPVWDLLDPSLQDAFALAATAARREGKDYISTRTLFAAFRRLRPAQLAAFFGQLPAGALPDSISEDVTVDRAAMDDIQSLSSCVQASLTNLSSRATAEHKLASEDIFIDIARHGTGESVRRLRTHGIDSERISHILGQLGWAVTERV